MARLRLSADVSIQIDWEEIDTNDGISTMEDEGEDLNVQEWTYGSGNGYAANDSYYLDGQIGAGETQTINFQSLPRTLLNIDLTRSWQKLKLLCIENLNLDQELSIGSSGTSNAIGLFGSDTKIGYSGIYTMSTPYGITVDGTHRNINIRNDSGQTINYKLLALGIRSG